MWLVSISRLRIFLFPFLLNLLFVNFTGHWDQTTFEGYLGTYFTTWRSYKHCKLAKFKLYSVELKVTKLSLGWIWSVKEFAKWNPTSRVVRNNQETNFFFLYWPYFLRKDGKSLKQIFATEYAPSSLSQLSSIRSSKTWRIQPINVSLKFLNRCLYHFKMALFLVSCFQFADFDRARCVSGCLRQRNWQLTERKICIHYILR